VLGISIMMTRLLPTLLAAALAASAAFAQTPAPAPPAAPAPATRPAPPAVRPAAPAPQVRIVRPREVTVLGASTFRVGSDRYQIAGVYAPRSRAGQCLMERLRGRNARAALRRMMARGEIRIFPTGEVTPGGFRLARVTVNGQSVRRRLINRRLVLARRPVGRNPWCIGGRATS
jgi:hypothetical protein